jgi:hypothetical protein
MDSVYGVSIKKAVAHRVVGDGDLMHLAHGQDTCIEYGGGVQPRKGQHSWRG